MVGVEALGSLGGVFEPGVAPRSSSPFASSGGQRQMEVEAGTERVAEIGRSTADVGDEPTAQRARRELSW